MEVALNHDTRNNVGSDIDTDVEDQVDVALNTRKPRHQFSGVIVPGLSKPDNNDGEPLDNNTYLHKYGGAIEDLNIQKAFNSVHNAANNEQGTEIETENDVNGGREVSKAKSGHNVEEIMEEEVVELEFEKAIPKLKTHTMHCPNCDNQITKVVLRRKIVRKLPQMVEQEKPMDLLGCFSCFSLFTSTDSGSFNPFPIFRNKTDSSLVPQADGNDVVREEGNCLSIFRVFRRETDSTRPKPASNVQDSEQAKPKPKPGKLNDQSPIQQGNNSQPNAEGGQVKREYPPPMIGGEVPSHYDQHSGVEPRGKGEARIDIGPTVTSETQDQPRGPTGQEFTPFEILKSIVYGGLMEVIASLSIVASAAAGDATTLNIVALALANLIGGVFVLGHNLWDLKDDCYKFSTQQTSNDQEPRNKYKELLGSVEHFPLHAFFAILSFLVFGIIPPVVYGYAFHETNDRDFTMVVVAGTSFVCVALLAIFKAYIDQCTGFSGYVKTITYYLTTAVAVSGVSYAVGNLVERVIEELGLFETGSNVAGLHEVVSTNPSLAYY